MKLSVIIPAYNNLQAVLTCLNSLQVMQALKSGVEYLVQDDASPDMFYPMLIPPAAARVARNEANLGFAGNCNTAAARANGDVLFFVNQDVYAQGGWSDGWDAALLHTFEAFMSCAAIGARLLFPNGGIQSAGGVFDALAQPVHRCLGWSNPHAPEVSEPCGVEWVTGAALAIRRDVFQQLGGFDTDYRMYFEDVDFCLRAREAGFQVFYEPRCTLMHSVGSTGGSPHFMNSAQRFKLRWVDTGKVRPGSLLPTVRYW